MHIFWDQPIKVQFNKFNKYASTSSVGGPRPHLEKFCIRYKLYHHSLYLQNFKKKDNFVPFELLKEHFKQLKSFALLYQQSVERNKQHMILISTFDFWQKESSMNLYAGSKDISNMADL